jgi:hypothetical protein
MHERTHAKACKSSAGNYSGVSANNNVAPHARWASMATGATSRNTRLRTLYATPLRAPEISEAAADAPLVAISSTDVVPPERLP